METSGVRFDQTPKPDPRRACDDCPIRRLARPFVESMLLNVMYNGINHLRGMEDAKVTPKTWWANMKAGFEWDMNRWMTNQFGHPYQGSNYFTAGRANGMSFWESSAVAAFGSATWEYFFESNRASLNDFINTTLGGITLGEVMYRSAWVVRDPSKTSGRREIFAAAIDPISGLERWMSGDMKRVAEKPKSVIPSSLGWQIDMGVLVQGASLFQADAEVRPFVDGTLFYGDLRRGRTRTPFDAFDLEIAGGDSLGHAQIHGRLYAAPFGEHDGNQFTILQTYEFIHNPGYDFAGQGFEAEVSTNRRLTGHWSTWMAATGGATVLAAANSVLQPADGETIPQRSELRTYDYGPGARFGGIFEFRHADQKVAAIEYQAYHVNVVDGTRANHILQRVQAEFRIPVAREFAIGAMGEYFYRQAYFWQNGTRTDESSQFRVFLAWTRQQPGYAPQPQPAPPTKTTPKAPNPLSPKLWLVMGGGFAAARAGCFEVEVCNPNGISIKSYSILLDVGVRATRRVDAGLELYWVPLKVNDEDPIKTTFVLGVVQVRPWTDKGLFLRAGMGLGIAGNGLFNPYGPLLKKPYTTNALGIVYGVGWEHMINRRWGVQAHALHHVAALGEVTTAADVRIRNVVGNYWTVGGAIVIR